MWWEQYCTLNKLDLQIYLSECVKSLNLLCSGKTRYDATLSSADTMLHRRLGWIVTVLTRLAGVNIAGALLRHLGTHKHTHTEQIQIPQLQIGETELSRRLREIPLMCSLVLETQTHRHQLPVDTGTSSQRRLQAIQRKDR